MYILCTWWYWLLKQFILKHSYLFLASLVKWFSLKKFEPNYMTWNYALKSQELGCEFHFVKVYYDIITLPQVLQPGARRRAVMETFHACLSCAASSSDSCMSCKSLTNVLLQVVFGLPLLRCPADGFHFKAVFTGLSSASLLTCPAILSLFSLTKSDSSRWLHLCITSTFVTCSQYLMFRIYRTGGSNQQSSIFDHPTCFY